MRRRGILQVLSAMALSLSGSRTQADASSPELASYYQLHMALLGGVAYAWRGQGQPLRQRAGVRQVGVGREACFALLDDGRLEASPNFLHTADDALAVKAHTGHALYLRRDGVVLGTGGNRFGPLSSHGLGDKADRWGPIFDGARAIATGSRHSLAIRHDGSLWAWGEGFGIQPRKLRDEVLASAAGDSATLALAADGALWQWDGGAAPRRLQLR
jgi:alpha-tubulin suppressor-like RCC1 family protein